MSAEGMVGFPADLFGDEDGERAGGARGRDHHAQVQAQAFGERKEQGFFGRVLHDFEKGGGVSAGGEPDGLFHDVAAGFPTGRRVREDGLQFLKRVRVVDGSHDRAGFCPGMLHQLCQRRGACGASCPLSL